MLEGDLHNFGRKVQELSGRKRSLIFKPRTVFWEWIFFGADSPIRSILEKVRVSDQYSLAQSVLGLRIKGYSSNTAGYTLAIQEYFEEVSPSLLQSFGSLLAYCYLLGIQDLHVGNVLRIGNRLQVVDAEQVLSDLLLPDQTLLIPFKEITYQSCGMSKAVPRLEDLTIDSLRVVLESFTSVLLQLSGQSNELEQRLRRELSQRSQTPIRVILRPTFQYRSWAESGKEVTGPPLMPEELQQLKRKDVPYFFKFLGDARIFFYTTAEGRFEEAAIPSTFQVAVNHVGRSPEELFSAGRVESTLIPRGLLLMVRKLCPSTWNGTLQLSSFAKVIVDEKMITVDSEWGKFSATRSRKL